MKRSLTALTAAIIFFCGCSVKSSAPEINAASSDNTTSIQLTDSPNELVQLQDFLLGKAPDTGDKNFDLNSDGRVDAFDLCLLRQKLTDSPNSGEHSPVLVAYFSCTSNTETIANFISANLGADTYQITPEIPYTEDDLKYYTDCRADREQKDPDARPAIAGELPDISAYDTIFVGYPIWHGQAPKIMYTFLENCETSGKTIVPFCTSASSQIGTSAKNLSAAAPQANWLEGKRFAANTDEKDVISWVNTLELSPEKEENIMYITVGDTKLTAELADNSSARALTELLKKSPLTLDMSDYGNFEKVGELGTTLPRNDEQITTEAGDLILYLGSRFVIYYDTNSWNFTRLGKLRNITQDELKKLLGKGGVTVTLSLE